MADYMCYSRTSYFRVTDEVKLREIVSKVGASLWERDGSFAFGQYGCITAYFDEEQDEYIEIFEELQEILQPGEIAVLYEVGHEKLRYVAGIAVIVTKDNIKVIDLENEVTEHIKKDLLKKVPRMWY